MPLLVTLYFPHTYRHLNEQIELISVYDFLLSRTRPSFIFTLFISFPQTHPLVENILLKTANWTLWLYPGFLVDSLGLCRSTLLWAVISNDFASWVFTMLAFFILLGTSPPNHLEFVAGSFLVAGLHGCAPLPSSWSSVLIWHILSIRERAVPSCSARSCYFRSEKNVFSAALKMTPRSD